MEGYLLIPPDRGTIIGRAIWKVLLSLGGTGSLVCECAEADRVHIQSRYVVVGNPRQDKNQPNPGFSQVKSAVPTKDGSGRASKNQPRPEPDGIYLSIYKSKEDLEPIQRHSISSITACHVRMLSHRKQGNVLPTLAIHVSPDPATDKLRKRRSSRTAGLTTTRESGPIMLWFRLGDDHTSALVDWAKYIQDLLPQNVADKQPISPVSPGSPTFVNPFPGPPSDRSHFTRSSSGNTNTRATLSHKTSSHTYGSNQNPRTLDSSGTPSVRSLESDVSSHASSSNVGMMGHAVQQYTSIMPDDLPSPTVTLGGYQDEFIEGWTSAQGRISTLSSPARNVRGSMGSPRGPLPVGSNSSSPPLPRETILDRAFQLRCIPGSEREVPGEEKLSSLARFDALMREAEERRKAKERDHAAVKEPLRSTWEEDDSENENRDGGGKEADDEDSDADGFDYDLNDDGNTPINSAHRALEFIASHRSSVQSPPFRHMSRNSVSYQESHSMTSGASIARPHTAHSKLRPAIAPRTISQPQPIPLSLDRFTSTPMSPTEEVSVQRHGKRDSVSSIKRLSFNEFTKRLSSTSSLLLVQTNQSTSSRGSSEVEGLANSRGTTLSPEREDHCGWRGSVGVFGGNDGGFI